MKQLITILMLAILTGCVSHSTKSAQAPDNMPLYKTTEVIDAPKEPIPRIELGAHETAISGISIDKSGKWLVSSASDGDIRVWDALTGRLNRVIRPPLGKGTNVVSLVAISPDGNLVAGSGSTQFTDNPDDLWAEAKDGYYIYLFNRADGQMLASIGEQPGFVMYLKFSQNGQYLAVTTLNPFKNDYRIRILKVEYEKSKVTPKLIAEIKGFVSDFDFSSDGKWLIAINQNQNSLDLYDVSGLSGNSTNQAMQLHPIATHKMEVTKIGDYRNCVKFSPDNSRIAVSFFLSSKIIVVSAPELKSLYTHDNGDVATDDEYRKIAWSDSGESLFAAFKTTTGSYLVRRWNKAGLGKPADHHLESFISGNVYEYISMAYHPANNFLIVSHPQVSRLASFLHNGKTLWTNGVTEPQFTNDLSDFMLSKDGSQIAIKYNGARPETTGFSILKRAFIKTPDTQGMDSPRESVAVNNETDETNKNLAYLDYGRKFGKRLSSVAADNDSILVADFYNKYFFKCPSGVKNYEQFSKCLWMKQPPSPLKALNISGDNRFAVAALANGSIKWYRYSDGEEVATLFVHPDRKRWVLYTPEGYFDSSPGGAELVGYHLNQGKTKEGKFIRISNLYDVFYRPDIIQAKMRGEDISSLITMTAAEALKNPPPDVTFTTIPAKTSAARAKVCYQVKSAGGGIGEVRLFQNGKLLKSDGFYRDLAKRDTGEKVLLASNNSRAIYQEQRGLTARDKRAATTATNAPKADLVNECVDIEAIAGENEISVAAFNATNTVQGSIETATFTSTRTPEEPHLYILSIGIDSYRDSSINLKYAAKDAKDFMDRLPQKARSIYKPKNIHLTSLTNQQAGRDNIMKAIRDLSGRVRHGDSFIFFNASHGVLLQNQYYIVTADFDGNLDNTGALISSNDIVEMSKQIKSLSQLFIFDTCHAGGVDNIVSGLYDARMVNLARKMGLHIYASAGSLQTALDGYKGNGLYTHTLLQGLEHGSEVDREKSGNVTVKNLGLYTQEKTTEISTTLGHPQTPFIINFGRDNTLFSLNNVQKEELPPKASIKSKHK